MNKVKPQKTAGERMAAALVLSLFFALVISAGATMAYLITDSNGSLKNTFKPGRVSCQVSEDYSNNVKSSVTVKNTGDVPAYIRVRLVSCREDGNGNRIGGSASISAFTLGSGWVEKDGIYYYTEPVSPGSSTLSLVSPGSSIALSSYSDKDGGVQVIEVMAEAIQSEGTDSAGTPAYKLAWGVTVSPGRVS